MDSQLQDYNEFLHKHKEVFYRYPLRLVHGIPLMEPIAQQWAPIENFQARPDDLLISTYPKAGLSYLVDAPSPRVIKTHLPFQLVPKSFWENNCKVIYVARNAKDNVVSYFFFDQMNVTQPEPGPWDGYVEKFMEGKVAWGSWYDHVRRYWDEKENHQILYVFYEDMKEDLAREVRRVMNFLEVDFPEEVVQKIVHHTSFQVMKENPMANYSSVPDVIFDKKKGTFMRKDPVEVHGIPIHKGTAKRWHLISEFKARPDDLVISSYPKSVFEEMEAIPSPRTIKTHLPIQLLPPSFWEQNCKDPGREIQKVARFLGFDVPESVVNKIIQHTTFESMKTNPMTNYSTLPSVILDQTVSPFMRKGVVGDWKEYFTVAQSEKLDDIYAQLLGDSGLTFRTQL
ncbi:hypothetical protein JD844_001629 [Phrynosoma platyrhinos]|uniref:Sulfotransferase n=1 Tax=Phrynosoma platyrhinos TaxID=52577 RepID=A0ABQ7TAT0_PHRPL|nr:hypothetical protein JD844_001629 [Phrynosoma platyrhinos]